MAEKEINNFCQEMLSHYHVFFCCFFSFPAWFFHSVFWRSSYKEVERGRIVFWVFFPPGIGVSEKLIEMEQRNMKSLVGVNSD